MAIRCEVAEERFDLRCPHVARMAFSVEDDEPSNPLAVRLLGFEAIMKQLQSAADLVHEFRSHARYPTNFLRRVSNETSMFIKNLRPCQLDIVRFSCN